MRKFLAVGSLSLLSFLLLSCGDVKQESTGANFSVPAGFEAESISDDLMYLSETEGEYLKVEGYVREGKKDGVWIYYYPERRKIERIEPYHMGELHGRLKEFSLNGNMTLDVEYKNGVKHGVYTEYKFGNPLAVAEFKNGKLEGERLIYFSDKDNLGKVQQKIEYKNGEKHGLHQYFNDEEEVVLEYNYKNGERIE
jgi:antitoxin component YwqK of YwqJK toxin-antitoxin module